MIEINLLPPEHRPVDRTPVPRLLTILVGVLLAMVGTVLWAFLTFVFIPSETLRRDEARSQEATRKAQAEEVKQLEAKREVYKKREETLRTLYTKRIRWNRVLDRLAEARKASGDVVLTKIDLKKGTATTVAGRRGEPTRQLHLLGYVPGFSEDAVAADLTRPYQAMVRTLSEDQKWLSLFESEADYRSVELFKFSQNAATSGKDKDKDKDRDKKALPKVGLKFHVIFTFKSTEPPKPPPPAVVKPVVPKPPTN